MTNQMKQDFMSKFAIINTAMAELRLPFQLRQDIRTQLISNEESIKS